MILVTGATGFVGRAIVDRLLAAGLPVRALVRDGAELPPGVERAAGDVTDPGSLAAAARRASAVVHLVAILEGSDEAFEAVNAQGTRNVVAAAKEAGAGRFLHMSAAGVSAEHAPRTRYWGSKWTAKQTVLESGLDWTVFSPSFVFRRGGGAFAAFERLVRMPVTPVIGDGRYRHQPVWLGDVAEAFARALERPQTVGREYELGGPELLPFDELLDRVAAAIGRRPPRKLHLPLPLMRAQSRLLRHFPEPLRVTPEQIEMLVAGTVCDNGPARADLGIEPAAIAEAYARPL